MKIGLMLDSSRPLDDVIAEAAHVAETGFASVWCTQIFGFDAIGLLGMVGREVAGIELGTAVVPIQPRHPLVMASQALTTQAATRGRFTLGVGLSHQIVVEGIFGLGFDRPVARMREYLSVLVPLLNREVVSFSGETVRTNTIGPLEIEAQPPQVVVAALGPAMLRVAGELASGTVTWMTGPSTVESHIVPTIGAAARSAGRSDPRVVVSLPVCVTADEAAARAKVAQVFAIYGQLPSYRAMLDREGAEGPADVGIVGDAAFVRSQLRRLESAGATDFAASVVGNAEERAETMELLAEVAKG
jgi:F420-dependent oxidoreductase-like protein